MIMLVDTTRTAIIGVQLSGSDYRRAHNACHLAAGLWNQAVDWVHSEAKNGSRHHRKLVAAKKKVKASAKRALLDFDHQVARKAANHVVAHNSGRLVYGDVRGIEQRTKKRRSASRHQRQLLSQWSRGRQEHYVNEKAGLEGEHLDEAGSTKTCPACGARNRPTGRDYRCVNPVCGFTCHRDAVGAINILQKTLYGTYVPIGPDVKIRVSYLRAVERWSKDQREAHRKVERRKVERRKARALSSARNRASSGEVPACEQRQAQSSTGPSGSDQWVALP